ncbi:MAG: D-alanyl-D-alanine carboxypeptidase family protein [Candidatus Peregrinibacteria bacterium]|nr:D-alanyl-D-alanine carboxypeptidase family protein [Candidatus Peregrinibacteria bacterium]
MFQAILSLLLASTLHAQPMDIADFSHKTYWENEPILSVQQIPQQDPDAINFNPSAQSVIAIDLTSGKILYEKNSDTQRPIASITKLMTALIIAEEETPYSIVKVSENAASTEGSTIWLNTGEEMTVKDLMYGMMISSGNDAAMALAEYNAGSMDQFVRKMNQKAEQLGLTNTNYSNPMGFDSGYNYSSASDVAILSMYVLANDFLVEPVNLSTYQVESVSGISHEYISTNELLTRDIGIQSLQIQGLKTGRTPEAGECLVTVASYENGTRIMTVVLASEDRFGDTENLLRWIDESYIW